jgi:hypothetical protein
MLGQELLDFVWLLSRRDSKSIIQKALKFCEEAGELAKKALPLESASGTAHRFVQNVDVLEEVADSFLVGLSIVHDLGFTPDDLANMMAKKALKWDGLQKREGKAPFPFEIHITVKGSEKLNEWRIPRFRTACEELGVKPLLIDAQSREGTTLFLDPQTSQVHVGDNRSAYTAMKATSSGLTCMGFEVVREKIETVPWHPAAPSQEQGRSDMPPHCYFESHILVIVSEQEIPKVRDTSLSGASMVATAQGGYGHTGHGPIMGYANEEGVETVTDWECTFDCPVANLERQSLEGGIHAAGGATDGEHCPSTGAFGPVPISPAGMPSYRYGDKGGASRFFVTVGGQR